MPPGFCLPAGPQIGGVGPQQFDRDSGRGQCNTYSAYAMKRASRHAKRRAASARATATRSVPPAAPVGANRRFQPGEGAFPIVGVGASAGGLEAFTELLTALPVDTGMAFVLVQHLEAKHESIL